MSKKWVAGILGTLLVAGGLAFRYPAKSGVVIYDAHHHYVSSTDMDDFNVRGMGMSESPMGYRPSTLMFDKDFNTVRFGISYHWHIYDSQHRLVRDEVTHNITTNAGAARLMGFFEGGVTQSSEADGSTGSSGTAYGFTVSAPVIQPGTLSIVVATIGTCVDNGLGECTGSGFGACPAVATCSTINYDSGVVSLIFSAALTSAHTVISTYKQTANWYTVAPSGGTGGTVGCVIANLSTVGQGCTFVGIYVAAGTTLPTLLVQDTMASHSNWTEVGLNYSGTLTTGVTQNVRQIWFGTGTPTQSGTGASGSASDTPITANVVTYTSGSAASYNLLGAFLSDNNAAAAAGATVGTLISETNLGSFQPIGANYTIQITPTISVTSG